MSNQSSKKPRKDKKNACGMGRRQIGDYRNNRANRSRTLSNFHERQMTPRMRSPLGLVRVLEYSQSTPIRSALHICSVYESIHQPLPPICSAESNDEFVTKYAGIGMTSSSSGFRF